MDDSAKRSTSVRPPVTGGLELALKARKALEDKKGQDIVLYDVRSVSSVTDYYLVVSGSSSPHLKAMMGEIVRVMKNEGTHCHRHTDDPESGWLVVDYFDVVIHILSSQARSYYGIDELWAQAPRVE